MSEIRSPVAYKRWRAAAKRMRKQYTPDRPGPVLYLSEFESILEDWKKERHSLKAKLDAR